MTTYKICHDEPKQVMRIGKARIWAGKRARMHVTKPWALRLQVVDSWACPPQVDSVVEADARARELLPRAVTELPYSPTLHIFWEDYSVPDLDGKWWCDLVGAIAKIQGDIGVSCLGGHGRTGTILSILAELSGACGKKDPVLWVRKRYCDQAVESTSQLSYIEEVTGRRTTAKPPPLTSSWWANKYDSTDPTNKYGVKETKEVVEYIDPWDYGEGKGQDGTINKGWVKNAGNIQSASAKAAIEGKAYGSDTGPSKPAPQAK